MLDHETLSQEANNNKTPTKPSFGHLLLSTQSKASISRHTKLAVASSSVVVATGWWGGAAGSR